MKEDQSRRGFLQRFIAVGAAALGGSTLLSACGGGETTPAATPAPAPAPAQTASACNDLSGLTDQEISVRSVLGYVEKTPDDAKTCTNCNFYSQAEGAACGACTLIKGPIEPLGYCNSWVVKVQT
jgi:hypothetical protein